MDDYTEYEMAIFDYLVLMNQDNSQDYSNDECDE